MHSPINAQNLGQLTEILNNIKNINIDSANTLITAIVSDSYSAARTANMSAEQKIIYALIHCYNLADESQCELHVKLYDSIHTALTVLLPILSNDSKNQLKDFILTKIVPHAPYERPFKILGLIARHLEDKAQFQDNVESLIQILEANSNTFEILAPIQRYIGFMAHCTTVAQRDRIIEILKASNAIEESDVFNPDDDPNSYDMDLAAFALDLINQAFAAEPALIINTANNTNTL